MSAAYTDCFKVTAKWVKSFHWCHSVGIKFDRCCFQGTVL